MGNSEYDEQDDYRVPLDAYGAELRLSEHYLRMLSGTGGGGSPLEAAGGRSAGPDLKNARIQQSLDATADLLGTEAVEASADQRATVLSDAGTALSKLAEEGERARITEGERIGLEAIVLADGSRPVLFVQDDRLDTASPDLGTWKTGVDMYDHQISAVARSVGRINAPALSQKFAGTGFVIAPGVVVTNRHVLQVVADEGVDPVTHESKWKIHDDITIDFAAEYKRSHQVEFDVEEVLFAGPDKITSDIDFKKLDMAVLRCSVTGDEPFPDALSFEAGPGGLYSDRPVYVMGFPGRPAPWSEAGDVLTAIFKKTYGYKRWAAGYVQDEPGQVHGDPKAWVHTHDASTLGGNSGSCVIDFEDTGTRVVGLHFGGQRRVENFAHAAFKLQQVLEDLGAVFP